MGALRMYRSEKPLVIAVGGSVGKTSTKEAIARVLEETGKPVRKTFGNLATDSGVPLSLLGFEDTPAGILGWLQVVWRSFFVRGTYRANDKPIYVLEYSSDIEGETAFLVNRIAPDYAVYCSIVPVHMEQYGTIETMVRETLVLHSTLKEGGKILANAEDPHQVEAFKGKKDVLWYGKGSGSEVKQVSSAMTEKGLKLTYSVGKKKTEVQTQVLADYQLLPILAAITIGLELGLDDEALKKGVEAYSIPPGRGKLIAGKNEMTIIDDTANSSPEAVKAGLKLLSAYAGKRRKVALLGNMNELGDTALEAHRDIAASAAAESQFFIAVGVHANEMLRAARDAGMSPTQMIAFPGTPELLDHIFQLVQRRDVIYVKASQNGMRLERVVKLLMAKPEEASKLLVRQGKFWQ